MGDLRGKAKMMRDLAEWFDNPNESPPLTVDLSGLHPDVAKIVTPGYLCRRIADELDAKLADPATERERDEE